MSHLEYWHPSERTLKYRVRWYTDRIHRKDFPPTDEGLLKLLKFFKENKLPGFGTEILVQKRMNIPIPNSKRWVRLPYAIPISCVIGYLKDKGLLKKELIMRS